MGEFAERAEGEVAQVVARVREVVSDIPPGSTMSYGDIARIVGTGPRQVGRIMATQSDGWYWWRVTRSDGTLPEGLQARALDRYADEGTPVWGGHADPRCSRWDPWDESSPRDGENR